MDTWRLTHTLLWEQIPGWILDWAVDWRWRASLLFLETQWTVEQIQSTIAHRIAYWEAKARLHQSARPETSSAELSMVALFNRILERKKIKTDAWLRDHDIDRSQFYVWKAAGGKPVKGKVATDTADKIKAAILRDGVELGGEIPQDLLEIDTVHDKVHDV